MRKTPEIVQNARAAALGANGRVPIGVIVDDGAPADHLGKIYPAGLTGGPRAAVVIQGPWHETSLFDEMHAAQPKADSHEDDELNAQVPHEVQVELRRKIRWDLAPSGTSGYIVMIDADAASQAAIWTIGENGEHRVRAPVFFDVPDGEFAFLARRPGRAWEHAACEMALGWLRDEAAQFPRRMLLTLPRWTGYTRARTALHPLSAGIRDALYH